MSQGACTGRAGKEDEAREGAERESKKAGTRMRTWTERIDRK